MPRSLQFVLTESLLLLDFIFLIHVNAFGDPFPGNLIIDDYITGNDYDITFGCLSGGCAVEANNSGILPALYHVCGKPLAIRHIVYIYLLERQEVRCFHQFLVYGYAALVIEFSAGDGNPVYFRFQHEPLHLNTSSKISYGLISKISPKT